MLLISTNILKIIRFALRVTGRGRGTALPGLIGEKYFYKSLSTLPRQLDKIIVITGTNGKTTTAKIIRSILKQNKISVIGNISGANLTRGILTALAFDTNIFGKVCSKIGVFEVEEASMEKVVKMLKPNIAIVTNLFRDQMDAYGELDHTREVIEAGLKNMYEDSLILLNANDPKVAYMQRIAPGTVKFFGLNDTQIPTDAENAVPDSTKSPDERSELIYSKIFFSHIGLYKSKDGKFETPKIDYSVKNYKSDTNENGLPNISFILEDRNSQKEIKVEQFHLLGLYNVINSLAAFSAIENLFTGNTSREKSPTAGQEIQKQDYSKISAAFGRGEKIDLKNGNSITLVLVKNPTGFNSVLGAINDVKKKNIIFALNDNTADGKDVSWIWDCNYEAVREYNQIIVTGKRAADLALRCKYADLPYTMVDTYATAIHEIVEYKNEDGYMKTRKDVEIYALCSYTALLKFREYLRTVSNIEPIEKEI